MAETDRDGRGDGDPFGEFALARGNMAAVAATRALGRGETPGPLILHGPAGAGKSHLARAACEELRRRKVAVVPLGIAGLSALARRRQAAPPAWATLVADGLEDAGALVRERDGAAILAALAAGAGAVVAAGGPVLLTARAAPDAWPAEAGDLLAALGPGARAVRLEAPDLRTLARIAARLAGDTGIPWTREATEALAWRAGTGGALATLVAEAARGAGRGPVGAPAVEAAWARLRGGPPRAARSAWSLRGTGDAGDPGPVLAAVAAAFGVPRETLFGRGRDRTASRARQAAMYLLGEEGRMTVGEIGALLGRDHSTVLHGQGRIQDCLAAGDPEMATALEEARGHATARAIAG